MKEKNVEKLPQLRLPYVDVIKGIGILLVIFQHCLGGGDIRIVSSEYSKSYCFISYAFILFCIRFPL